MNSFGRLFRVSTWGESHGKSIGGTIDGCPSGLTVDMDFIKQCMQRRRPGQSDISSPRNESDNFEILSGVLDGKTTGQPIAFIIHNNDQRSADYEKMNKAFRPSHADYTYAMKYGMHDRKGGGRSSARETANWVMAGAIAQQLLRAQGISVTAYVKKIGSIELQKNYDEIDRLLIESNTVRCPDTEIAKKMSAYIEQMKLDGNTCGGMIQCAIEGLPVGIGEPIFDKFHARLAQTMLGINAARAFELGEGVNMAASTGAQMNDAFVVNNNQISTATNHSAGIQGGITNGMPVWFQVHFKPVSSIGQQQHTVDADKQPIELSITGRHDPCVVPRAVPIVEALAALVSIDFLLLHQAYQSHA